MSDANYNQLRRQSPLADADIDQPIVKLTDDMLAEPTTQVGSHRLGSDDTGP